MNKIFIPILLIFPLIMALSSKAQDFTFYTDNNDLIMTFAPNKPIPVFYCGIQMGVMSRNDSILSASFHKCYMHLITDRMTFFAGENRMDIANAGQGNYYKTYYSLPQKLTINQNGNELEKCLYYSQTELYECEQIKSASDQITDDFVNKTISNLKNYLSAGQNIKLVEVKMPNGSEVVKYFDLSPEELKNYFQTPKSDSDFTEIPERRKILPIGYSTVEAEYVNFENLKKVIFIDKLAYEFLNGTIFLKQIEVVIIN